MRLRADLNAMNPALIYKTESTFARALCLPHTYWKKKKWLTTLTTAPFHGVKRDTTFAIVSPLHHERRRFDNLGNETPSKLRAYYGEGVNR
jgi:hypothetical protein